MVKVKAVFFDLDDTLVLTSECDKVAFAAVCALAKQRQPTVDDEAMLAAFKKRFKSDPWDTTHAVEVTQWRVGHWAAALKEQGIDDAELAAALQKCFDDTRLGDFPFIAGTQEMVDALTAAGIAIVIITNGHHFIQREKIRACAAEKIFSNIIVGGEEVLAGRPEKPAASIFLKACEMVGVLPSEAVHVGDSLKADVAGGNGAGLAATVFVSASGAAAPMDGPQPTFTVKVATETMDCIAALEKGSVGGSDLPDPNPKRW